MNKDNSFVYARIDRDTKKRASIVLKSMGLSISDTIQLLLTRIAEEKRLPPNIKIPNTLTKMAIQELKTGRSNRFKNIDDLMNNLHERN